MKNIVVEGARGLGKSSVTKYLRENTTNSTLINFTGFNEKGREGKVKVMNYYDQWLRLFSNLKGQDFTFIHDRFFFSEMVYSKLYKDYDFTAIYEQYLIEIPHVFDKLTVVFLWTNDEVELARRLIRDKANLFGDVTEDVINSLKQQAYYSRLFQELISSEVGNVEVHVINVDGKTVEQIGKEILAFT